MHGIHSVDFMSKRRSPLTVKNMEAIARSKEKNPSSSMEDMYGLGGSFFDDIRLTDDDFSLTVLGAPDDLSKWRMPTPPQSPPQLDPANKEKNLASELPDLEESVDLASLMQINEDLDNKDLSIFDNISGDISDLIDYMSAPEMEDFMEQESELDSFNQPKLCTQDVMIGDDIMWSESSASISSGLKCKEIRAHMFYGEEQALQSDVLPPVNLTKQDKLSHRDRSIALGTDTPSDSGNEEDREVEVDVVTEHPSDLSLLNSPEQISVRVKAKRDTAAKEPKVEIEMDPSDSCFCPSTSAGRAGRHHHLHHIPVDHHNYSLPPSPAPHKRNPLAHSRHSSPESSCRDRISSSHKKGLSSHTVESALQQALQIKAAQIEDFGSQVYRALHSTRKGGVQKGQKRGRVGRPRNTPIVSAPQSSSASSSPMSSPSASPSQTVLSTAGCKQRHSLMDFEDDVDRRNQHNVLERNRRVLLQLKFQSLRTLVPSIKDQEKASKVVILNSAERHIKELRSQEAQIERERKTQMARNETLRRRLAQLSRKRDSSHHN